MKFTGKIKNSRGEIIELKNGSELNSAMRESAQKDGRIAGQAEDLLSKNSSATFRSYLASQGVTLKDAIRALGYTNVPVKLHHEVVATLKVHVTEEA